MSKFHMFKFVFTVVEAKIQCHFALPTSISRTETVLGPTVHIQVITQRAFNVGA